MKTTFSGTIHGRTIELADEPGLPDGQQVTVTVQANAPRLSSISPEALQAFRDAAGSWAEDGEELDRYLEWNRQQRQANRREIPE